MKKFVRDKCDWQRIGENIGGSIFWCADCGAIVNDDDSGLENPMFQDDLHLCYDQGKIP